MTNSIEHVTHTNFDSTVLESCMPVLVDYWAEWCGPCKTLSPLLDQAAQTHGEQLRVVKVNVDESRDIAARYGVRGIPTLMLFKAGRVLATRVGALSEAQLSAFLEAHV
jgi:thioredoxin 1